MISKIEHSNSSEKLDDDKRIESSREIEVKEWDLELPALNPCISLVKEENDNEVAKLSGKSN